jgi:homoserine O-acetyltransferase
MNGRLKRDHPARGAAKVKPPARLLASLALLALAFNAAALPQRRARTSAAAREARAALLNPRHKFWNSRAPDVFRVRFETSKGDFVVEARRDWAPRGADRLYNLARAGFFDDSRFFRVRAGFIAQFGIPGDPRVAAPWQNQTMPDDPVRQSNTRGSVSYAMTGPDARTTQLFINLADNSRLDKDGFAPVGRVVEGMDVVDRLYSGYGEDAGGGMRGGRQGKIFAGGNAYLDREFPKLDKLGRAVIERTGQYLPR